MIHFAYTYSTAYTQYLQSPEFVQQLITALIIFSVFSYIVAAFLLGRVFKKANVPQWAAWVPVYNLWKLLEMGDQQKFWAIVTAIPYLGFIGVIYVYIAMYHIGKKFGKQGWFVLVAIFIPILWLIWLGFDDSKWPKKHKKTAYDPIV